MLAAWAGLVTGLLEGAGLLGFQELGWLNWNVAQLAVASEILWISPVFDLLLFSAAGLVLWALARWLPRLAWTRIATFVLLLMAFFDLLALSGKIRLAGAIVLAAGLATVCSRWIAKREEPAARFRRRSLPWVAALTVLLVAGVEGGLWWEESRAEAKLPAAAAGQSNILVIVVDTLRADHLSGYGYGRATSPNVDRLAEKGVLFENTMATSSWTLPSHASLLTGLYPFEHGAEEEPLDARSPVIGEALMGRGYRTGAFSANYLFFSRPRGFGRGFIRFEDFFNSAADMAQRTVYGRKFEIYVRRPLGFEDLPSRKLAADINRSVLRWIDRDGKRPFFAFLNYFDVHDPYLPPEPYRSRFAKVKKPGGIINEYVERGNPRLTAEQLQSEVDAYDGAIAYMDEQVRRLLEELAKRGLEKNTLVVFTSDHGEMLGEHGGMLVHRNSLYREVIRVPLIFYQPGTVPAGVRVARPVTNAALPATLLDLIGAGGQSTFPGPSLAEAWRNADARVAWPEPLAEIAQMPFEVMKKYPVYSGWLKSLLNEQWHFIAHQKERAELYDLTNDPGESRNLAATPEGESVAKEFESRLQTLLRHPRKSGQTVSQQGRNP